MARSARSTAKKPYRRPRLREYGDLRQLTETNVGGAAATDGGMYGGTSLKTSG